MNQTTKRWILIIGGLVILLATVFFLFFYQPTLTILSTPGEAVVFLDQQRVTTGTPIKLAPGTYTIRVEAPGYLATEQTISLGVSQVVDLPIELRQIPEIVALVGSVREPVLSTDESAILYLGQEGRQFFQVKSELGSQGTARTSPITDERFRDLSEVIWSPDRELTFLKKTSGETTLFDFQRYNFLEQEEKLVSRQFLDIAWHPTERRAAAFQTTPEGEKTLVEFDVASGTTTRLADLRTEPLTKPDLAWSPDGRQIMFVENGVFLYTIQTRQLAKVAGTDGARGATWSPTSQQILVDLTNDLLLVDVAGTGQGGRLGVRTELAKTAWSPDGSFVIAAVRTDLDRDQFVKLTTTDLQKSTFAYTSTGPIAAEHLLVSDNGRRLWLISAGTLYSVLLEEKTLQES